MFNKKIIITLINENWEVIKNLKCSIVPRNGEYVYVDELKQYYSVINVVYNFTPTQSIFVIVKAVNQEKIWKN
jgi:hypothetical protein